MMISTDAGNERTTLRPSLRPGFEPLISAVQALARVDGAVVCKAS
jgi:hypothetical protein